MGSHHLAMAKLGLYLVAAVLNIAHSRSENTYVIAPIPDDVLAKLQVEEKDDNTAGEDVGEDYALGRPRRLRRPFFLDTQDNNDLLHVTSTGKARSLTGGGTMGMYSLWRGHSHNGKSIWIQDRKKYQLFYNNCKLDII